MSFVLQIAPVVFCCKRMALLFMIRVFWINTGIHSKLPLVIYGVVGLADQQQDGVLLLKAAECSISVRPYIAAKGLI